MSWISFSILAAIIYAIVNIVDKYVLEKWIRKPIVPVIIMAFIGAIAAILIFIFRGFSSLPLVYILIALGAGGVNALENILYFKAAQKEEISRVVPLWYISPIFILAFAVIFLGEQITAWQYIGVFFLAAGAILISIKDFRKIKLGKSFWYMIASAFFLAILGILTKYLLDYADFWTIFAYIRLGVLIALIPIFFVYYPDLKLTIKEHGSKVIGALVANESLNMLGILLLTIATSVGYITLVGALSSLQPLFLLIFTILLSLFVPSILKEKISRPIMLLKFSSVILIIIGVILIT